MDFIHNFSILGHLASWALTNWQSIYLKGAKKMTIYVLSGFNNYYNRIVKKFNTVEEYLPYELHTQENYNFVPNDGVNTQVVLGSNVNLYDGTGDYLLAVNDLNEIISRWFVIESVRDRAGQYTLTLHRDLVSDFYDNIIEAPMFIEKATLPYDSPLIFNSEQMTFNQIKTNETLLKDRSECPWLVGYYSKGATIQGTVDTNNIAGIAYKQLDSTIEQWEFYQYSNLATDGQLFYAPPTSGNYIVNARKGNTTGSGYIFKSNILNGTTTYDTKARDSENFGLYFKNNDPQATAKSLKTAMFSRLNLLNSYLPSFISYNSQELFDELLSYDGSLVKDINGRYFEVKVNPKGSETRSVRASGSLEVELENIALAAGFTRYNQNETSNYEATITCNKYSISLIEKNNKEVTYNITSNANRILTTDAPWNIFAIPYGKINVTLENNTTFTTDETIAINTASSMLMQESDDLYDLQLLPYCPMIDLFTADGSIKLQNANQYSLINIPGETPTPASIVLNVEKSKFSFDITTSSLIRSGVTNIEKKINNECNKWRLTSPNYSNYFDFSVEKNGGIQYFNVDCEYKPFTPYIHINPNFNGLYGYDDNSPRGLVLGGDFSLSRVKNAWETYLLQNKNFQNIFDRQIQNMEVNQKYQRVGDIVGVIPGVGTGTAAGALAGSSIKPGGIGTGIGAAIGGVASLAGGIADIQLNEKLRNEALDYTKDMFGYQLGNIQALPNTISKVSAFNNNNKIFPILEYYTCTETEKKALANKLAYNGMTVMVIGKISDYMNNFWSYNDITSKGYIKGKLIRLDGINEDFHLINAISGELDKGVYIN